MKTISTIVATITALTVTGLAAADPVRFEVVFTNPVSEPESVCFDFDNDGETGLPILPAEVTANFFFDDAAIPTDDVGAVILFEDLTDADVSFGDATWTFSDLLDFELGTTPGAGSFISLDFSFGAVESATTVNAVATGSDFELEIIGSGRNEPTSCEVVYTQATAQIVDIGPPEPPMEEPFTHREIAPLGLAVKSLWQQGVLKTGELKRLRNRLGLAYRNIARSLISNANHQLDVYNKQVDKIGAKGRLTAAESEQLTSGLSPLQVGITDLGSAMYAVESIDIPSCMAPVACGNPDLIVDLNAAGPPGQMDGSDANPFNSIASALAYSDQLGWQCVDIELRPGTYAEGIISITRDTRITGEPGAILASPVQNYGDNFLAIRNVDFVDSGLGAAALDVQASVACTIVEDSVFSGVAGTAIAQAGGALSLRDVSVSGTTAIAGDQDSGTAIRLSNGVDACLSDMALNQNAHGALLADDQDTRVFVTRSDVKDNAVARLPFLGAISASNGSLVLGSVLIVTGNETTGVGAYSGASMHLKHVWVDSTKDSPPPLTTLAVSALVVDDAKLQLSSFELSRSGLIGFQSASLNASLADGFVRDNPIGVNVQNSDLNLACLQHNVAWIGNDVDIDGETLPIPEPQTDLESLSQPLPSDTDAPPQQCAYVPFVHPWCVAE